MKKFLFPLILFISCGTAFAQAPNTLNHSAITFKIKNLGISTDGSIGGLQAIIHFNPASLASATIEAAVDVNTINTGNSTRDEDIKSDEFFDVPHYPKILLKSVSIKHKSGDKYTGEFNLTIKNKTKIIEIPFTFTSSGDSMAFNGNFKINRLDYGVGTSSFTLSNEVIISIDAGFKN